MRVRGKMEGDRTGSRKHQESASLRFLYHTAAGRILLKPLVSRGFSSFVGSVMDTRFSKVLIPVFLKGSNIDLSEYETDGWQSFNDCFHRRIRPGMRSIDRREDALTAPCDGLLTVLPISGETVLPVKQSSYTLHSLLKNERLAKAFDGGTCLVFRLCVNHYHRYGYVESGRKSKDVFLPGVLHTVRPIALEAKPVFAENCREYTLIQTKQWGTLLQMEVGAMLVGRIVNEHPQQRLVERGEEKGHFDYGGSTIIVLLQKDRVMIREDIREASAKGAETPVRMGEAVGFIPAGNEPSHASMCLANAARGAVCPLAHV